MTTLLATAQLGGTIVPVNPALDALPMPAGGKVRRRELAQVAASQLTAS